MRILANLPDDLLPISEIVLRYLHQDDDRDESLPGLFQLSRRTKIGPEAFAIRLFEPLAQEKLSEYEKIHSIRIPLRYKQILETINGVSIFNLEMYGIPPSMAQHPPLLDRSQPQPLDLATANQHWRYEFELREDGFHFGSAHWSLEENIGYFLGPDSIMAYRKNGELVGSWRDFKDFLSVEIVRCERHYEGFEEFMCQALKKINN